MNLLWRRISRSCSKTLRIRVLLTSHATGPWITSLPFAPRSLLHDDYNLFCNFGVLIVKLPNYLHFFSIFTCRKKKSRSLYLLLSGRREFSDMKVLKCYQTRPKWRECFLFFSFHFLKQIKRFEEPKSMCLDCLSGLTKAQISIFFN